MLPRNPSKIFRSRWSAIWWAIGILFFAVTTIGFGDRHQAPANNQQQAQDAPVTDALGDPVSNADMAALKKFIDQ